MLSGLEVGRDVDIVYTGLRPGEKLFEELFIPGEVYARTAHEKIFVCRNGAGGRGAEERRSRGDGVERSTSDLQRKVDALIVAAQRGEAGEVRRLLHGVVPEYRGDTVTR